MLAKVIAHGDDRPAALRALDRALADTAVLGVTTNIEFLRFLLADPDVAAGRLDTGLLDRRTPDYVPAQHGDDELIAAAAYKWLRGWPAPVGDLWDVPSGWRMGERAPTTFRLRAGERTDHVYLTGAPSAATARVEDGETHSLTASLDGDRLDRHPGWASHRVPRGRNRRRDLAVWAAAAPRWSRRCVRRRCGPTTNTAATRS